MYEDSILTCCGIKVLNLYHVSSYPLFNTASIGALLLLWSEALQAGYIKNCLQLYPVTGSTSRSGLYTRPQQHEL